MIRGKAIDMAGRRINEWYVTGRAYVDTPTVSKAKWWVVCPACGVERFETGSKLRAAEENRWVIWCRACGLNKI